MKCAIMQPTYLPWAGYFNLLANVDIFVFLDDVQYEARSWQSRNRLLINSQPHWITIPVKKVSRTQIIKTVVVDDDQSWRKKHIKMLEHAYAKHPYNHELSFVKQILSDNTITFLANINIELIKAYANKLHLNPQLIRASDLNISGRRSDYLLKICEYINCDTYLSPVGSAAYLAEDGTFENSSVKLIFQDYNPQAYLQFKSNDFISHLSIVDVIANLGCEQALNYVKY